MGVVLYEMLVGRLPFSAKSPDTQTQNCKLLFEKILHDEVAFPMDISEQAKMIIRQLMTKQPAKRLGSSGDFEEIKTHKFFSCINWKKLSERQMEPPFKPLVSSETDTRYFDKEFTGENVQLTPPSTKSGHFPKNSYFDSFSYYGSKASLNSQQSYMSIKSTGQVNSDRFDLKSLLGRSPDLRSSAATSNENLTHCFIKRSKFTHGSLNEINNDFEPGKFSGSSLYLGLNSFPNMIKYSDSMGRIYESETCFSSSSQSSLSSHSNSFNLPIIKQDASSLQSQVFEANSMVFDTVNDHDEIMDGIN